MKRLMLVLLAGAVIITLGCAAKTFQSQILRLEDSFTGEWEFVVLTLHGPEGSNSFDEEGGPGGKIKVNSDHTFSDALDLGIPHGYEHEISGTWHLNKESRDTVTVIYTSTDPVLSDPELKTVTKILRYSLKYNETETIQYLYLEYPFELILAEMSDGGRNAIRPDQIENLKSRRAIFVFKRQLSG